MNPRLARRDKRPIIILGTQKNIYCNCLIFHRKMVLFIEELASYIGVTFQ